MKKLSLIRRIISDGCIFFTIIFLLIYSVGVSVDSARIPTISMTFSLLIFSIILSSMNRFLFSNVLVFALRFLIHYTVVTLSFYTVFVKIGGFAASGGSVITILAVYTIVYLMIAAAVCLVRYIISGTEKRSSDKNSGKTGADENYVSIFEKKER